MNRTILGRVATAAAFVAGGWLAATVAHGETPLPQPSREVLDLQARVKALEAWHAQAGTFTSDANGDWSFAPPRGNVKLASGLSVTLQSGLDVNVWANSNAKISGNATATLASQGRTSVTGSQVLLNGGGKPAATMGSTVVIPAGSASGQVVTGSASVLVGP